MTSSATASSTPRLSEAARHVVVPKGIKTTVWPRVVAKCAEFGVTFDPWQHGIGSAALGKRGDGKYAATVGGVVLSIPRQVGKTYLVGMTIIALCILFPKLTVVWTAQHSRTSTKTFQTMQGMVRRKRIWPHVAPNGIRTSHGEQEIAFRNGSVIMLGARALGFGRGFDEIDVAVFDEAQILTERALEDIVPALNQARHEAGGLLFFMGTPPRPVDNGEEFTNRRDKALSGKADSMLYVEFSADPDADPDDREQWAKANPSYPNHTPTESMERMRENLTDDLSFKREALGIWDPVGANRVIDEGSWRAAGDELSRATDRLTLGIEAAPDLAWASVSLAGRREDGRWHGELLERRDGTAWVAPLVAGYLDANPNIRAVVVDEGSPSAALVQELADAKIRHTAPKVRELGAACTTLVSQVVTGDFVHTRQPQMWAGLAVAGKRPLADTGMWTWSRSTATADITPVLSLTLALWGAQSEDVKRPRRKAGSSRRVVTV